MSAFLEPGSRPHSHLDTMILEHLNNDMKAGMAKIKSDSSLSAAPDAASHAKVVKYKDQYRIPNLPVGPKSQHSSSSSRPNSVTSSPSVRKQQHAELSSPSLIELPPPLPHSSRGSQPVPQKSSPPASKSTASSHPSGSGSSSSQQKVSQSKSAAHANRSSPQARHSPHTPEPMSQYNPMAWNMHMFHSNPLLYPAVSSAMTGVSGLSPSLSRPVIPAIQGTSLPPPDPFLTMHSYAAPPGGKGET
jgi:hypothetical protein